MGEECGVSLPFYSSVGIQSSPDHRAQHVPSTPVWPGVVFLWSISFFQCCARRSSFMIYVCRAACVNVHLFTLEFLQIRWCGFTMRSLISSRMPRQMGNISVAVLAQFAFGAFSSVPTFLHTFSNSFDFTRMGA